jgi:2-aminoadipate transaminase
MIDWQSMYAQRVSGMKASEIRDAFKLAERPDIISFAGGFPAPESFPVSALGAALAALLARESASALQYAPTEGIYELRKFIAERMQREGVSAEPENVVITNGSQQALDLIFKLFVNPGDPVIYELPAYIGGINAAVNYEARPVGIPLDDHGIDTNFLEERLAGMAAAGQPLPKLLYTIPNFHNPAGVTMSPARRRRLLELACQYGFLILEDNPYGDLRIEGEAAPHIKTFDSDGHVIYLGSFSKTFLPGIRLGWMVAPEPVIRKVVIAKQGTDLCSNSLGQKLVCEFARAGLFEPHIRTLRDLYRRKRDCMLAALDAHFPAGVHWTYPEGGFFVWVTLPAQLDARELLPQAITGERVAYVPGGAFFVNCAGRNTIRLAYSQPSERELEEGVARLGRFLTRAMSAAAPRPDTLLPLPGTAAAGRVRAGGARGQESPLVKEGKMPAGEKW